MGASMVDFPSLLLCLVAGFTSHLGLFIRGEWENKTPTLAAIYAVLPVLITVVSILLSNLSLGQAMLFAVASSMSYAAGLFGSMALYRLYFHPLRPFPGPAAARLTGFWSLASSVPGFQWHRRVADLHETYGDFVRIRPREISISHPDAVQDVHGLGTKCLKGPFYDLNYPSRSLQMTRDKAFHARRRRVWDRGFSAKALQAYEPRIRTHCKDLIAQLSALAGSSTSPAPTSVDATAWSSYFGFDVMGDLSYGKSFDMLRSGRSHQVLRQMNDMKPLVGALVCVPWLFVLVQSLPLIRGARAKWIAWCGAQVEERRRMHGADGRVDLFSFLTETTSERDPAVAKSDLVYDSELAIVAGSDTTAATLAAVVYLLAKYPAAQEKLREELDPLTAEAADGDVPHSKLVGKVYLEGVINEALRLYPPVPSGVQRMTPPEGARIAGCWIPGDTIVSTPTYTIQRDARNFPRPTEFLPERWSTRPDLAPRKDNLVPFSAGAFACAGRPLALMELRLAVASLVRQLTVDFVDREEAVRVFEREPGVMDCFTVKMPPVLVRFVRR